MDIFTVPLLIGRGSASDLYLQNEYVSRQHAQIQMTNEQLTLQHLGETHKTIVQTYKNGRKQTISLSEQNQKQVIPLKQGDTIYIFPYTLKIEEIMF